MLGNEIGPQVIQVNKRNLNFGCQEGSTDGHICSTNAEKAIFALKLDRFAVNSEPFCQLSISKKNVKKCISKEFP
ncbi:hypothetical protein B0E43_09615 [Algoriphagus sp. A40]|nr:hypothetical protein B0E43_09615 [Algoriphagus sp. A40]